MKRHLAILLMILAWFVYGAMPAGACPMCDQPMPMGDGMQMPASHAMPGMAMAGTVQSDHQKSDAGSPCGGTHLSFCLNCLAVPPLVAAYGETPAAFSYPGPALARELRGDRPAPAAPPPRAA